MEQLLTLSALDRVGTVAIITFFAFAVITRKLVWHTDLKEVKKELAEANKQTERWQRIALNALTSGAQAGVRAAEVTADVVSALPDPARERAGKD